MTRQQRDRLARVVQQLRAEAEELESSTGHGHVREPFIDRRLLTAILDAQLALQDALNVGQPTP